MSTTPNGWAEHIQSGVNQQNVIANAAFDTLEEMIAGSTSVDLSGASGDTTLTTAQAERLVLVTSGALSAAVNLIVPAQNKLYALVHNGTGYGCTLKTAAGTGVTLASGEAQFLYCDGTNVTGIDAVGYGGGAEATAKTKATATGAGGTSVVSIGANVDPNSVEVVVDRVPLEKDYDYTVTESVPASGNYDQITPAVSDMFASSSRVVIYYYPA